MFGYLYIRISGGDFLVALQTPLFVVILIFPFLPAIILSVMAKRLEGKLVKLLGEDGARKS